MNTKHIKFKIISVLGIIFIISCFNIYIYKIENLVVIVYAITLSNATS